MIEKMNILDVPGWQDLVNKVNELIDAHNNHFHHARELQFGTDTPQYVTPADGLGTEPE